MNGLMTASEAESFYNKHTAHRYSSPGSLMDAMKKASDKDGPFAWLDPTVKRNVTNGERILAFIEYRNSRPPSRHNRKTVTSKTVSRSHGRPVGKAAERQRDKPLEVPAGGEIRITKNGIEYIYLPPAIYGEPVRRF